jgi:murein DD-endopeptidase MepM/ murein hydrolase activator NlpD
MGEVPCEGNPLKNPRIAEQNNSGVNGGREGYTRSEGTQFHSGLDLKNDVGGPWFSPYNGNIDAIGETKKLGHYVTIRFQKNGIYYTMQFGHLQDNSWPPNGSSVNAGDVIGIQGLSGNLESAILDGDTNDIHSHIIVRKRTGPSWHTKNDYGSPVNPENFLKTKFDANGNPISGTDC